MSATAPAAPTAPATAAGLAARTARAARTTRAVRPAGTPRWAERAALATVWTTVPSGLWRLALGVGIPVGFSGELAAAFDPYVPGWGTVYVLALSGLAELLAFLTLGLVRPWGEVLPRRIPLIGGRAVRPWAAIVPAALGSTALTAMGMSALFGGWASAMSGPGAPRGLAGVIMTLCYLPLVAWGPLLAAVTFAYARRTLGRRR
ncbi:hypothetical protein ACFVUH_28145 [Kitasatospora sp. NPDC058032]|uniref:hypothetical protein n=1 Tax=Kitasatospora sp. NPDC058032 TaxID=3346307 RepID=UPI0036DA6783